MGEGFPGKGGKGDEGRGGEGKGEEGEGRGRVIPPERKSWLRPSSYF